MRGGLLDEVGLIEKFQPPDGCLLQRGGLLEGGGLIKNFNLQTGCLLERGLIRRLRYICFSRKHFSIHHMKMFSGKTS